MSDNDSLKNMLTRIFGHQKALVKRKNMKIENKIHFFWSAKEPLCITLRSYLPDTAEISGNKGFDME